MHAISHNNGQNDKTFNIEIVYYDHDIVPRLEHIYACTYIGLLHFLTVRPPLVTVVHVGGHTLTLKSQ